jgi:hypothetical protein
VRVSQRVRLAPFGSLSRRNSSDGAEGQFRFEVIPEVNVTATPK